MQRKFERQDLKSYWVEDKLYFCGTSGQKLNIWANTKMKVPWLVGIFKSYTKLYKT